MAKQGRPHPSSLTNRRAPGELFVGDTPVTFSAFGWNEPISLKAEMKWTEASSPKRRIALHRIASKNFPPRINANGRGSDGTIWVFRFGSIL